MNGKHEFEEAGGPHYGATLARGRRTIATSIAVFAALGLLIDLVTPSVYRATARIEMRRPAERSTWVGQPMADGNFQSENVALSTEAELITNRGLLSQLATEINTPGTQLAEASRGHERGFGPSAFRWLGGSGPGASTAAAASTAPQDPAYTNAQIEWLERNVRVEPVKDTRLVDVHVEDTSPRFARALADRLVRLFIGYQARRALEADTLGFAALAQRLGIQPGADAVDAANADPRVVSIAAVTARRERIRQSITGLNEAIVRAHANRIALEAQVARARRSGLEPMNDPGLSVIDTSNLSALRKSLADTQVQLAAARRIYRDGHPKIIQLKSDLAALQSRLRAESQHSLAALRAQAATMASEEASLTGALASAEGQLGAIATDDQGRTVAERSRVADEALYEQMLSRLRGSETNPTATPAVALVDPASVEPKPVRPHRLLNLVTCMAAGALAGAGLVLARAGGRTMLTSPDEAEALVGLPVLAELGRTA